jgi:hypothetical protein
MVSRGEAILMKKPLALHYYKLPADQALVQAQLNPLRSQPLILTDLDAAEEESAPWTERNDFPIAPPA